MPQQSTASVVVHEYQGPIPDPDILVRYKNADPSFPERIIKMAETHNAADVLAKNRMSLSNLILPVIGQVFTFVLGLGGIVAGIHLAKVGHSGPAVASVISGFSPIVITALRNLRRKG